MRASPPTTVRILFFALAANAFCVSTARTAQELPQASFIRATIAGSVDSATAIGIPVLEEDEERKAREEIVKSDQMQDALVWLDEFFAVQVELDEHEKQAFYDKLREMNSAQLRWWLRKLERVREGFVQRTASSRQLRERRLSSQQDVMKRQEAARDASLNRAYRTVNRQYFGVNPYAVAVSGAGSKRKDRRRYGVVPPPLITSREVARITVVRSIFGRRGGRRRR